MNATPKSRPKTANRQYLEHLTKAQRIERYLTPEIRHSMSLGILLPPEPEGDPEGIDTE